MAYIASILSGIAGVYMLLIYVRILLSWFAGAEFGGLLYFLRNICDPYLDWWRRFRVFRSGALDFSPVAALVFLSLLRGIFDAWGALGRITLGMILFMLLNSVWSVVSWILGFCIVILVLRLVAFWGRFNVYSPFWRFVDYIARPVIDRISRVLFPGRIVSYVTRIIVSIVVLSLMYLALWALFGLGGGFLQKLPV